LTEAAAANQSILILQDDCDFLLPQARDYVMPECDVFYGGYSASDPRNPAESEIIGAHFMGFSARATKAAVEYLSSYLLPDFAPDPVAAAKPDFQPDVRPPIDGAFVWFRRAHPNLTTVFAMLSVQRSSRTDIGHQKWFDRAPGFRVMASFARACRGRWRRRNGSGRH
jgi:glycosyl transferase family 25